MNERNRAPGHTRALAPIAAILALSIGLGACQTSDMTTGKTVGTLAGAAAGGLLGSQIGKGTGQMAAIAVGTLLGAALGHEVGAMLTENDIKAANANAQQSLEYQPSGNSSGWRNPDSGASGTFTPYPAREAGGSVCRDYTQTIMVEGRQEQSRGTACRNTDGTWRIAN